MRRIAGAFLVWFACLLLTGVQGRKRLLRSRDGKPKDVEGINRHRQLFFNRRRNPYSDDSMSRTRIRNRLHSSRSPDPVRYHHVPASGRNPNRYQMSSSSRSPKYFTKQMMTYVAVTQTKYFDDDDYFQYQNYGGVINGFHYDYEDEYYYYYDCGEYRSSSKSKSKSKSKSSKSKGSKSSSNSSGCRRKKKLYVLRQKRQDEPTEEPTEMPTQSPTVSLAPSVSFAPTGVPSVSPTNFPTLSPTTGAPTTATPTGTPTTAPTKSPTVSPTTSPTKMPTAAPTKAPTVSPTTSPTKAPTASPTTGPTNSPTTGAPTLSPTTGAPTVSSAPTEVPSIPPTLTPTVTREAIGAGRQKGGGGLFVDDQFFLETYAPFRSSSSKSSKSSKGSKSKGSKSRRYHRPHMMMYHRNMNMMMNMNMMGGGRPFFTNSQDPPFRGRAAGGSRPKTPLGSTEPPGAAPSEDGTFGPTTMDEMMEMMEDMDGDMDVMETDGDESEMAPGDMADEAAAGDEMEETEAPENMEETQEPDPDQRRFVDDDSKSFEEFEPTQFPN